MTGERGPRRNWTVQSGCLKQRFAPGTLVQAGPGVPHWHYAAYPFNWSGPVDAAQTVHFLILSPWLVGIWRVLGVVLLIALFVRLMRDNLDLKAVWRRLFSTPRRRRIVGASDSRLHDVLHPESCLQHPG